MMYSHVLAPGSQNITETNVLQVLFVLGRRGTTTTTTTVPIHRAPGRWKLQTIPFPGQSWELRKPTNESVIGKQKYMF